MNIKAVFFAIISLGLLSTNVSGNDTYKFLQGEIAGKDVQFQIFSSGKLFDYNKIHSWLIVAKNNKGQPLKDLNIKVSNGGMEAHGHGLPTSPVIETASNPGEYWLKGMKFQMPGEWFVEFSVTGKDKESQIIKYDFVVTQQ